jgi:hypothetical protein
MGAGTIFLIVVVVAIAIAAFVVLGGAGGKLTKDQQEGELPSQRTDERPEHLAVTTDAGDTPEPRPARTEPAG